jgi:hypothetical protein
MAKSEGRGDKMMCLEGRGGSPAQQERMACSVMKSGDKSLNSAVKGITGRSVPNPLKAAKGGRD